MSPKRDADRVCLRGSEFGGLGFEGGDVTAIDLDDPSPLPLVAIFHGGVWVLAPVADQLGMLVSQVSEHDVERGQTNLPVAGNG